MHAPVRLAFAIVLAVVAAWLAWHGIFRLATLEEIPWRDPRYSAKVGSITMLITSVVAALGAYYLWRTWRASSVPSAIDTSLPRSRIALYLTYAGIPGAVCATVLIFVFTEVVDLNDAVYPWLSFSLGPPALIAMLSAGMLGNAMILRLLFIVISSFGYFWAIGIPAGMLYGLLPTRTSRGLLWTIQWALVALHLMWGYGFLLLLKA